MSARAVAAIAVAGLAAIVAPAAFAYFSATKTSPQPISVTPTVTVTATAVGLIDTSSGNVTDATLASAYDDNRLYPKDDGLNDVNFEKVFATNRFYQWDYESSLPPGQPVSGASFDFRFRSNAGTEVACFYFEVISGGNVIGTHGSQTPGTATSPWCTDVNEKLVSTPLPSVTTTTIANGLRIKVYGYESNRKPIFVDQAIVKGTTAGQTFTLYATTSTNQADGSPETLPNPIAFEDSIFYDVTNNWENTFTPARYIQYTFPPGIVPSSTALDSVKFRHRYQAGSGSTVCFYLDVIAGGNSLGTVPASPGTNGASCAVGTGSWVTDSIPLPMVNAAAQVNGLVVRLIYRTSSGGKTKSREDWAAIEVAY